MTEPWEIKIDDIRKVDSIKVFIIFCEDGAVENRLDVKMFGFPHMGTKNNIMLKLILRLNFSEKRI
jgi:hypothetical protein